MAEEILYDEQVVTDDQGDPKDPLGLRKKLSATKTKDDPLGLRAKLKPVQPTLVTHEQALALPKIDYSKPVFQENVSESTAVPQVNNQALLATPPRETVADKFENKVKQSRDKVFTELTTNDKAIENLIRKQKFEEAGRAVELPNSDMSVNGALANDVARMVKPETRPQDMPVTPEEMQQKKALVANDDSQARRLLEEVVRVDPSKKSEVQKSIYDLDIANALQNDPNGQARVRKVLDNSKKLESGELVYDWRQGRLFKPENIAQSFITGWKAKTQALDDYYKFRKIENNDAIAMELDARMASQDPDAPTPIPEGKLAQGAEMLGGTPAKAYAAGAAGSLLGPQAGMVAGAAVGAREMAKLEWNNTFQRTYAELRQQGVEGFHAVSQARKLADEAAETGAVTGLVTGLIGGRIGMKALPKVALNEGFRKAAVNGLKGLGSTLSPAVKEGLLAGGVAAGGEMYKNALAKEAGLNRNIDDNVAEQIESNLLFTVGMAAAIKGSKLLSQKAYKTLLSGLSRADEGYIDKTLSEAVENGQATEADVTKLKDDLSAFKKEDSTIPENISPEARLQISEQIKKRNALEAKMEATDKAFHPAIKEQIKGIEENINALSEDKVKAPDEHKELNKVIDSAIEEGLLTGIYKDIAQKDPEGFFRELADQIHGKNTDGSTSLRPDAEIEVRTQFGDDIVDKVLELYPPEPPKQSSISVIRPEERTQPTETVTIKPQEIERNAVSETENIPGGEQRTANGETNKSGFPAVEGEDVVSTTLPSSEGPQKIGITHAQLDNVAKEFGFDTYEGDPETVAGWDFEAAKRLREDPNALPDLFARLRNGGKIDHIDNRMMIQYMADLKAKIDKAPSPELLNEFKRAKSLFDVEGRAWGKAGRARQGERNVEETLADFLIRDSDANKAPLTEKQVEETKEQFSKIEAAKEKVVKDAARMKEQQTEKEATAEVEKIKKESKKDAKKDYKKERQEIIEKMRADLLKVAKGGGGAMSSIPGAAQLAAIAPHVAKLVRNLVEDGIQRLPEIVKAVHNQVKDFVDGITEKDVHNIIAGEYNAKRPKRSAILEKVLDLQLEAKYVNQLEALEAGKVPKSEKQKRVRNRKIQELRDKIKEHDLTKLTEYKKRVANEIAKLKEQLSKNDFAKEDKEPVKLDDEARKSRDELLRLREDREISLLKKEYESRPGWKKGIGFLGEGVRTGKVIKSSFDVSFLARQAGTAVTKQLFSFPFKKVDGKWTFNNFEQQKSLRRQIAGMYKSFGSESIFKGLMADIKASPRFEDAQKAGLNLSDPNSPLSIFREEESQKSWAERIPGVKHGVKASNRAASAISNQAKWDIYNQFVQGFEDKGMTFKNSPDAYKEAAKYANQLLGRGFLGQSIEKANAVTSPILWSLRLQASRLQLLTKFLDPRFYTKVPPEIRVAYFKDMAKFIATGTAIMGLANAAGLSVGLDPRDSDFGSIIWGDTRFDIWGGFKQYAVLFTRLLSGQTSSEKKGVQDLRDVFADDLKYGEKTRADILGRFARTKTTPEFGLALDLLTGAGFDNKPITPLGATKEFFTPLLYKDFRDAMKDGGVMKAIITALISIHGVGANTYGDDESSVIKQSSGKRENRKTPTRGRN